MNETVPLTAMYLPPATRDPTKAKVTNQNFGPKEIRTIPTLKPLQTSQLSITKNHPTTHQPNPSPRPNQFHRFISHQHFELFLLLAAKVKLLRQALATNSPPHHPHLLALDHSTHAVRSTEVSNTARFFRTTLVPSLPGGGPFPPLIPQGVYPSTDRLMEEAMGAMAAEYGRCAVWYAARGGGRPGVELGLARARGGKRAKVGGGKVGAGKGSGRPGGDAIAVKYSKRQTDVLTDWMIDHKVRIVFAYGFLDPGVKRNKVSYAGRSTGCYP